MLQKIKIDRKNFYGIKELNHEFLFTSGKQIHLVYALNGSMKTSFAKTMRYLSGQSKEKPCDAQLTDIMTDFTQGKGMRRPNSVDRNNDLIMQNPDNIIAEANPNQLLIENKVCLSIAIGHLAENYMYGKMIVAGKSKEDFVVTSN